VRYGLRSFVLVVLVALVQHDVVYTFSPIWKRAVHDPSTVASRGEVVPSSRPGKGARSPSKH